MAYAAVVTLLQIVEDILHPRLDQHRILHDKQQLESLQEKLKFFHGFLEESWQKQGARVKYLERKIRDVAYKAQDTIEYYISIHFFQEIEKDREMRCEIFVRNLEIVMKEVDSVKRIVSKQMDKWGSATNDHHTKNLPTRRSTMFSPTNRESMVGFDDDLVQLKGRLTSSYQSKLQIIPVVGMGGTGKTTLTENIYNDDYIVEYFDVRAWVTVSQQYKVREILLGLLESISILTVEMRREGNDYLSECLYKNLKDKRFLIVMDDVWATEVMDKMKMLFPDDHVGSRIMITTRLSKMDSCLDHQHHMRFLSEDESWNLLCSKVFPYEGCPLELEESGKKIARSCKGLPLAIVVISSHLTKVERARDKWDSVAENVNSIVIANDVQCSELLSLSYDHLPHHLKACFLYFGLFREDEKIHVSKLLKLWVAEGFLMPVAGKSLEEVAEEYLEDLVSRNLVLIDEKRIDGKVKTCIIHDLLRELCVRKAKEEMFHHVKNFHTPPYKWVEESPRRLAIDDFFRDCFYIILAIHMPTRALSLVRSLIYPHMPCIVIQFYGFLPHKLLRVLDMGDIYLYGFPVEILDLVHLRYLAFSSFKDHVHIPEFLPDYLWNLQTLIIYQFKGVCSMSIQVFWKMTQLRHLQFNNCYLLSHVRNPPFSGISALRNLQTLSKVNSSCCTPEFFKTTPNLKKLGIRVSSCGYDEPFSLGNLVNLHQLRILKCIVEERGHVSIPKAFCLPQNLRKLTLVRTRIPWKDMVVVGSLPNLLELKLIDNAFEDREWGPFDGGFCELKHLLIERSDLQIWRAERDHFPRLEQLRLRHCSKLEEIPCSIGHIPTLNMIELDCVSPSALSSAKQILDEQRSLGNQQLQVSIVREHKKDDLRKSLRKTMHIANVTYRPMRTRRLMTERIEYAATMHRENIQSVNAIVEGWKQREKLQKERLHGMQKVRLWGERMERQRNRMKSKWMSKYPILRRGKL